MKTPLQSLMLRWGVGDACTSKETKIDRNSEGGKPEGTPSGSVETNQVNRVGRSRWNRTNGLILLVLGLAGWILVSCMDQQPQAGVISTENAGRVMGSLVRSDSGKLSGVAEIRLVRLDSAGPKLISRTNSDASGGYAFETVPAGTYRVDASLAGGLTGSSAVFEVKSGKTSNLVVVLVVAHSFQFILVPGANETVVSVWAGDPDRTVSKNGQSWSVPVVPGTEMLLGAVLRKASGSENTLHYRLVWRDGAAGLVALDTGIAAPKVDSVILTPPVKVDPKDSLVAHWVVDSSNQSVLKDRTGNGFDLSLSSPGVWSHVNDTNLTHKVTGRILYQVKVKLSRYPSSSLHNRAAVVVGFYEGLKLAVNDYGQFQAAGQRGDGTWSWFGPQTKDSAVPLGRWVELAVGADNTKGDMYVWIDGKAVAAWNMKSAAGSKIRIPTSTFVLGQDAVDGQKFDGQIAEVKVWNKFVLGEGLASGFDACIDPRVGGCTVITPPKDTTKKDTIVPRKIDSLVAHWVVDSSNQSVLKDRSGNGFDLGLSAPGVWQYANDTNLTQKVTGQILYQAKVWLDKYPSSSVYNRAEVVVGFYEGLKLMVTDHGQLAAGAQRGDGTWSWFAPETKDSVVPLGRWADLAVGADQSTGDAYAWIDGKAVATWSWNNVAGSKIRVPPSKFMLGEDSKDGQKFSGKISEVKVWNRFVLGAGIASGVDSCINYLIPCRVPVDSVKPKPIDTLVAHWVVDSSNQSVLKDRTGHGFDLGLSAPGVWQHANDPNLTHKATGRILYQATVWLDRYPSSSLHNNRATLVGFYEGLKLMVNDHGQLQAAGQRGDGTWTWFGPETKDSAVPLGRWVELAVGTDNSKGDMYVWVDGKAVPTWSWSAVSGSKIRVSEATFTLGADQMDGQKFDGKISEVKVWNKFVLGEGLASGVDPCIDRLLPCTLPVVSETP